MKNVLVRFDQLETVVYLKVKIVPRRKWYHTAKDLRRHDLVVRIVDFLLNLTSNREQFIARRRPRLEFMQAKEPIEYTLFLYTRNETAHRRRKSNRTLRGMEVGALPFK